MTFHLGRGAFGDTMCFEDVEPKFFVPFLNAIDDDGEYAAALLACLEMIRNGTTCFLEAGTAFSAAAPLRQALSRRSGCARVCCW